MSELGEHTKSFSALAEKPQVRRFEQFQLTQMQEDRETGILNSSAKFENFGALTVRYVPINKNTAKGIPTMYAATAEIVVNDTTQAESNQATGSPLDTNLVLFAALPTGETYASFEPISQREKHRFIFDKWHSTKTNETPSAFIKRIKSRQGQGLPSLPKEELAGIKYKFV